MSHHHDSAALARLYDDILDLLKAGPKTITELAAATGFSRSTVRIRLGDLADEGGAHYIKSTRPRFGGIEITWHVGPGEKFVMRGFDLGPVRRDPLVAALFGPANDAFDQVSA
jgi:hypothetical protein